MRALVVGGAGFIGSHLVDRLLAGGDTVDVVDNLSSGSLGNLADARASGSAMRFHHLDATAPQFGELVGFRAPEVIFLLADVTSDEPAAGVSTVVNATLATLEAARAHGVGRVVVACSAPDLYGDVPAGELPVREGLAFSPSTPRGVAHRTALDLLALYRARQGVEFVGLLVSTVYGPRQGHGIAYELAAAGLSGGNVTIAGDGRETADFVYIDDVVDALARAAVRGNGLIANVSTGVQTSVRELAQLAAGPGGVPKLVVAASPLPVSRFCASPVRARIHLSWSAWTTIDAGMALLLDSMS